MAEVTMTQASVKGASVMALGGMVPSFTGDGHGVNIVDFLHVLEAVGRLGGWSDAQLVGIARCKMVGAAYDFAWHDEAAAAAKTYAEFKERAQKRFDTEPECEKLRKFMCACQKDAEDVQSFAARLRTLGNAAMGGRGDVEPESKREIRRELLDEQLRTQFLNGLRGPIKRFTLSRDPKTLDEAVDAAVLEERNERAVNSGQHPYAACGRATGRPTSCVRALKGLSSFWRLASNFKTNKCATATAGGGALSNWGPVTTAGSTATFRGTVENHAQMTVVEVKGKIKSLEDELKRIKAFHDGLSECFECDVGQYCNFSLPRVTKLEYDLHMATEVPNAFQTMGASYSPLEKLTSLAIKIPGLPTCAVKQQPLGPPLSTLVNTYSATKVFTQMMVRLKPSVGLQNLYVGIMDSAAAVRGLTCYRNKTTTEHISALAFGRVTLPPAAEDNILATLVTNPIVAKLADLNLNGVIASVEGVRELANWVADPMRQQLCSLTVFASRDITDELYVALDKADFGKRNYRLVELCTLASKASVSVSSAPTTTNEATALSAYNKVTAVVRRNAAELNRAAQYILTTMDEPPVVANVDTLHESWGTLSLLSYRDHPYLPRVVCDLSTNKVLLKSDALDLIEKAVAKVSFQQFAWSVQELHARNSKATPEEPTREAFTDAFEAVSATTASILVNATELNQSADDKLNAICYGIPQVWDYIRDKMDVGCVLLNALMEKTSVCSECTERFTKYSESTDASTVSYMPRWAFAHTPEISPQKYVQAELQPSTLNALFTEMKLAHLRTFFNSAEQHHNKPAAEAADEDKTLGPSRRRAGVRQSW